MSDTRPATRPTPYSLVLLSVLLAAGCASRSGHRAIDDSVAEYEAGRYATAHSRASDAMRSTTGKTRDEAAYLAGLTAYRMGDLPGAERSLLTATKSSDPTTAANARATLGLVRLDQNRPNEAAALFKQAASGLTGNDSVRATQAADTATARAGNVRTERTPTGVLAYPDDLPAASPGVYANRAPAYTATTTRNEAPFALQVGAFQSRARADRVAAEVGPMLQRARLGPPRVLPKTDRSGRRLFAVQFGRFTSRGQAAAVRSKIGRRDCIVVPAA